MSKITCSKGHELTPENTRVSKRKDKPNYRRCVLCERAYNAVRNERRKQAVANRKAGPPATKVREFIHEQSRHARLAAIRDRWERVYGERPERFQVVGDALMTLYNLRSVLIACDKWLRKRGLLEEVTMYRALRPRSLELAETTAEPEGGPDDGLEA